MVKAKGLPNEKRGVAEEAEWPTACRQPWRRWRWSEIVKGLAEEGRAVEKETTAEEKWAMEERGVTEERGAVEEAEWPRACQQPGRGQWRSEIVKGLAEEGRPTEKERAAKERGATEERGAMEEAAWPMGVPTAGEGMVVVGVRERPYGGGEGSREIEGDREREGGGGERGCGGERGRMAHGHAGRRGGDGGDWRSRKALRRRGGRWRKRERWSREGLRRRPSGPRACRQPWRGRRRLEIAKWLAEEAGVVEK